MRFLRDRLESLEYYIVWNNDASSKGDIRANYFRIKGFAEMATTKRLNF